MLPTYLSICKTYILYCIFLPYRRFKKLTISNLFCYVFMDLKKELWQQISWLNQQQSYNRKVLLYTDTHSFYCIVWCDSTFFFPEVRHGDGQNISIRQLFPSFKTTHLVVQNLQLVYRVTYYDRNIMHHTTMMRRRVVYI